MTKNFFLYLMVCALVTYLIRMLPLALFKNKIKNKFLLSFLYYIPYAVLSVMTVPSIFDASGNVITSAAGFGAALICAYRGKSLVMVAAVSCLTVFVLEAAIKYI